MFLYVCKMVIISAIKLKLTATMIARGIGHWQFGEVV